jgi:RES domain-containing protein
MSDDVSMPWSGRAWHATSREHAPRTAAELDGYLQQALERNIAEGGRFNPPGEFGAVYLSLDPETPLRESDNAEVLLALDGQLGRVLDLADPGISEDWGLSAAHFCDDEHGPCQRAARAIRQARYEAVRYPSARGRGLNLVVFWDIREPGSVFGLVDSRTVAGA